MVGSTTFSATTANQFGSVSFTPSNTAISANNNNINLRIIPKNPIGSNTYLRIIYSPDLLMSFLYGSNNLLTVPNQISGQPSGQILLGNLSRNSSTSAPTLFSLTNFFLTNPPYSTKPASITFRT